MSPDYVHIRTCATERDPRTNHVGGNYVGEGGGDNKGGVRNSGPPCVFAPEVDVRAATAVLVANVRPAIPAVSYEYATQPWLADLRRSFRTRARALRQCSLDWPRMQVQDDRSYVQRAMAYFHRMSDLQVYFANQAALAKPFQLLLSAYSDLVLTQCSASPTSVLLRRDGTVLLGKAVVALQRQDLVPLFRVHISVDVRPDNVTITFRPVKAMCLGRACASIHPSK